MSCTRSLRVLLLLSLGSLLVLAAPKRERSGPKKPKVNARQLAVKLDALESKFTQYQSAVSSLQQTVRDLSYKFSRIQTGGSAAAARPSSSYVGPSKFSDDGRCPIPAVNFYYSHQFRSCYRLEPRDVLVNFTEARSMCREFSPKADLVSIESKPEQEFLQAKWLGEMGIASTSRFWTSARRNAGKWFWESNNKPLYYTNWVPTTDHSDDRFSCMAVYSNEAYLWGDVACWAPHLVTCEINL